MPSVTDASRPSGLPNASTSWPGPQRVGIAEGERRQRLGLDLDHRQIGLVIDRHDLRADGAPAPAEDGASGLAAGRRKRQLDLDARRVLDHVRVGHDVAVGIDDDAGPAAALEDRLRRRREDRLRRAAQSR